jgi:hypothetical protein
MGAVEMQTTSQGLSHDVCYITQRKPPSSPDPPPSYSPGEVKQESAYQLRLIEDTCLKWPLSGVDAPRGDAMRSLRRLPAGGPRVWPVGLPLHNLQEETQEGDDERACRA